MKFTCTQKELSQAVAQALRAIASRPTSPLLANFLIVAQSNEVQITGYDLSIGIQSTIPADVQTAGAITVPARLFSEMVTALPDEAIDFTLEGTTATIKTSGTFEFQTISAQDYPLLPTMGERETLEFSSEVLEALSSVIPFTSDDATKAVLQGINLRIANGSIEFAATDGHRLSVASALIESTVVAELTVPVEAMQDIQRLGKRLGEGKRLSFSFDSAHGLALTGNTTIFARLLDGQYPNYLQLIPQAFAHEVVLNKAEFTALLERAAIVAKQTNLVITITFDDNQLTIAAEAGGISKACESMAIAYGGPPTTIGFNVSYLMGGAKVLNSQELLFSFNSSASPVVIQPLGGAKVKYLVMPVQVRI